MSLTAVPVSQLSKKREREGKKKDSVPSTYNYSQSGCKFTSLVKRGTREGIDGAIKTSQSTCINESSFFLIFKSHKVHINIGNYAVKPPSCQLHTGNIFKRNRQHMLICESILKISEGKQVI